MIVIGLTGSIGMGKTTTAKLFAEEGVPVLDSDEVVHGLYRAEAVAQIEAAFPGTTVSGVVDREKLGDILRKNPANFRRLEEIVHPLVRKTGNLSVESKEKQPEICASGYSAAVRNGCGKTCR